MSEVAAPTRRTRSWQEVRVARKPCEDRVAAHKDRMLAQTRVLRLREVREGQGLTQVEVAARMHVTRPSMSALERGDLGKAGLATIRAYVETLGGKVEMIADFGDHKVVVG